MNLYKKYADSNDYNLASRYYSKCYGKDIPDKCDDKFKNKPAECYQKAFIDTGCLKKGNSYPRTGNNMTLEDYKGSIRQIISTAHNNNLDFNTRNKAYQSCYGGSLMTTQNKGLEVKQGLNAYLYDNISNSGVPGSLLQEQPVRISNLNNNWGSSTVLNSKKDNIYLVIKSYITYPKDAKNVKFRIGSDDGSRLYINGKVEIDNWGLHGFKWGYGSDRSINNRVEELTVHMYESYGGVSLRLQWSIDGKTWQDIPNKYFNSTIINKQETGYNKEDYIMYGPWFANRKVPVKRIVQDGQALTYMTEDGPFTKMVKMWGGKYPAPTYYRGRITEYGTKDMIRAPNGVYKVQNIKTGETLGIKNW
jgi:hypothetical protein